MRKANGRSLLEWKPALTMSNIEPLGPHGGQCNDCVSLGLERRHHFLWLKMLRKHSVRHTALMVSKTPISYHSLVSIIKKAENTIKLEQRSTQQVFFWHQLALNTLHAKGIFSLAFITSENQCYLSKHWVQDAWKIITISIIASVSCPQCQFRLLPRPS